MEGFSWSRTRDSNTRNIFVDAGIPKWESSEIVRCASGSVWSEGAADDLAGFHDEGDLLDLGDVGDGKKRTFSCRVPEVGRGRDKNMKGSKVRETLEHLEQTTVDFS